MTTVWLVIEMGRVPWFESLTEEEQDHQLHEHPWIINRIVRVCESESTARNTAESHRAINIGEIAERRWIVEEREVES